MLATRFALAAVLALAFLAPVNAAHCASYTTSTPWVSTPPVEGAAAQYHLIFLECQGPDCWPVSFVWIYEESNGIPGLQRGDEFIDDTCHGSIRADTIIL